MATRAASGERASLGGDVESVAGGASPARRAAHPADRRGRAAGTEVRAARAPVPDCDLARHSFAARLDPSLAPNVGLWSVCRT